MKKAQELRNKQKGATVIEYALIAALVSVVAIVAFQTLGSNVSDKITEVGTAIENAE